MTLLSVVLVHLLKIVNSLKVFCIFVFVSLADIGTFTFSGNSCDDLVDKE